MLSENQKEVVKNRVNADADIPFMGEETEGRIIDHVIDHINPHIEPALRVLCPKPYVDCLKIALAEGEGIDTKRERICSILNGELAQPLAGELSRSMDVAMLPERWEEKVMEVVSKKIIEEMVEWTVAEIDERMESSLQRSREAAGR